MHPEKVLHGCLDHPDGPLAAGAVSARAGLTFSEILLSVNNHPTRRHAAPRRPVQQRGLHNSQFGSARSRGDEHPPAQAMPTHPSNAKQGSVPTGPLRDGTPPRDGLDLADRLVARLMRDWTSILQLLVQLGGLLIALTVISVILRASGMPPWMSGVALATGITTTKLRAPRARAHK